MNHGPFRLYPSEQHWWSFNDYAAVLAVMAEFKPKRVLEFGPGSSTLALLEGGAEWVDSCEDDPGWFVTYVERLEDRFPDRVRIHPYACRRDMVLHGLVGQRWDMALIDGPAETVLRKHAILYALEHCTHVLVPLEEHTPPEGVLRLYLSNLRGPAVRWLENTGPLAGAFALLTP